MRIYRNITFEVIFVSKLCFSTHIYDVIETYLISEKNRTLILINKKANTLQNVIHNANFAKKILLSQFFISYFNELVNCEM